MLAYVSHRCDHNRGLLTLVCALSPHLCFFKRRYWESVLEDSLDLIAKLPTIAATIYRCACPPACLRALVAGSDRAAWRTLTRTAGSAPISPPSPPLCPHTLQQHLQGR